MFVTRLVEINLAGYRLLRARLFWGCIAEWYLALDKWIQNGDAARFNFLPLRLGNSLR
jgi:hypothetical protein